MAAPCGFISDGYTKEEFIAATEFHPSLKFSFRPLLFTEVAQLTRRVMEASEVKGPDGKTDKGAAESQRIAVQAITERLETWDLADNKGTPVAIKPENVARVEPHLLGRLYNIMTGGSTGDPRSLESEQDDSAKN